MSCRRVAVTILPSALLALGLLGCDDGVEAFPDGAVVVDAAADAAPDAAPPACAPLTGAGTEHGANLATAETWTAAASPHVVRFDTSVSATITIEACAVVRIGADQTISVRAGGALVAQGEVAVDGAGQLRRPVRFERLVAADSWASIRALGGGTLSFTGTIVDGGGDPLSSGPAQAAALDVSATTGPAGALHAAALRITGSESHGVTLHDGGSFDASSTDVRISGAAVAPVRAFAAALGTLPDGDYTGNAVDEIEIPNTGTVVATDLVLHARGVPYRVGDQPAAALDVAATTGVATLTIEPGVTLRFGPGGRLRIDPAAGTNPARGALIAVGTAAAPIVLTSASATPAAGDWQGLWLGGAIAATTRIQHVRIEDAGGASVSGSDSCLYPGQTINDAAIRVFGPAAAAFVTDTVIVDSAGHGIDRGFRSDTKPDFLPSNTFTRVARCRQTYPRDLSGACPMTVPCP